MTCTNETESAQQHVYRLNHNYNYFVQPPWTHNILLIVDRVKFKSICTWLS